MSDIVLRNGNGMSAVISSFGGILKRLIVPDRNGNPTDVVLGFADDADYADNPCFLGALVGPVCNRTADASFTIDGETYHIPVNENGNNLHSDTDQGFHKRTWTVSSQSEDAVTLALDAPDGDLGFPGKRHFTVRYELTEDNALRISYHAETDRPSYINPTNHSYFNLDGDAGTSVLDHTALLFASRTTPVREGLIPTGEIREVAGTPFDFLQETAIGARIDADDAQLRLGGGYDHNFLIDDADGTLRRCAIFCSGASGIRMEVSTTLPAFQFYTGNFLQISSDKTGRERGAREGFCIETQYPPDAPHHDAFPQPYFSPKNPYDSITVYRFTCR